MEHGEVSCEASKRNWIKHVSTHPPHCVFPSVLSRGQGSVRSRERGIEGRVWFPRGWNISAVGCFVCVCDRSERVPMNTCLASVCATEPPNTPFCLWVLRKSTLSLYGNQKFITCSQLWALRNARWPARVRYKCACFCFLKVERKAYTIKRHSVKLALFRTSIEIWQILLWEWSPTILGQVV